MADMVSKTVKCQVCSEMFTKRSNMYAHMRNVHKLKGEKDPVFRKTRKKTELCTGCGKAFTTKHNLQRHMQKMHVGVVSVSHNTRIKCPIPRCEQSFATYNSLRDHLVDSHGIQLLVEDVQFASEEDFQLWKEDMQNKTVSLYVADTSKKTMKDGTQKQYYNCHRSYTYRGSGQNKRRLKSAGSIKMGTTCPARLEVTIEDEQLNVKFWKTHIGHNMDLEHIHLSKAARTEIADKMRQGHSFQQILNDIHNGTLHTVDLQRALLVKRKDLHNIFRDFHIGSIPKQFVNETNDAELLRNDMQQIDTVRHNGSFQEIFDAMQNETLQENESVENTGKINDVHDHTFQCCEDIPLTSALKENVPASCIEDIHQLTGSGPILYFEEQTPTVIHLTGKNQEYSVTFYEEVGTEDCNASDQDICNEKDQNGLPILYHEEVAIQESEVTSKAMCPTVKDNIIIHPSHSPKLCDVGCPDCGQMFTKRKNLYAHMRNIHKLVGDSDPVSRQKHLKTEICNLCGKAFTNKSTVRRHRQKIHNEGIIHTPRIRCPDTECTNAFSSYSHLREHLFLSHQKELEMEQMHFICEKDFLLWKDNIQANTVSLYVLDTSKKIMKDGTEKKYYNCHRSHNYKSTGKNIRKLKSSGSSKIGRTCPSRVEVMVRNGQLDVKFWKTHMGHSMDINHTTLSKAVRNEIAEMLKKGASFEHVLDVARNGKLQSNQSQRTPLINRKDLHNICRDFRITLSSIQATNDSVDVKWCVEGY